MNGRKILLLLLSLSVGVLIGAVFVVSIVRPSVVGSIHPIDAGVALIGCCNLLAYRHDERILWSALICIAVAYLGSDRLPPEKIATALAMAATACGLTFVEMLS